jgi:hypothetical protein
MLESLNFGRDWACTQSLAAFYRHLDESRFSQAAQAFATDGTWQRQGKLLMGPQEILKALNERSKSLRTRHVLSCTVVTLEATLLRLESSLIVHSNDDGCAPSMPATISTPHAVMDSIAIFDVQLGAALIKSLSHRAVFLFEGHKS